MSQAAAITTEQIKCSENLLNARCKFHQRCQRAQETLAQFVEGVRELAERCHFHPQEEPLLIRDRVIVGLWNIDVQHRILQTGGNPSLTDAVGLCEQWLMTDIQTDERDDEQPREQAIAQATDDSSQFREHIEHRGALHACDLCETSFRTAHLLRRHMVTHSQERSIKCTHCDKRFKCDRHVRQHIKVVHEPAVRLPCPQCDKFFKRPAILQLHLSAQHANADEHRQYECYVCKKSQKSLLILRTHLYGHRRTKDWLCPQCGLCFKAQSMLNRHLMRADHHEVGGTLRKPLVCGHCEKRFADRHTLANHARTHSGERPFQCSACGKMFSTRTNLRQHSIVHSEQRPFQCRLCDYRCKTRCNLQTHLRAHERSD